MHFLYILTHVAKPHCCMQETRRGSETPGSVGPNFQDPGGGCVWLGLGAVPLGAGREGMAAVTWYTGLLEPGAEFTEGAGQATARRP